MANRDTSHLNTSDETLIEYRDPEGARCTTQIHADVLVATRFESAEPIREIPSWQGKNVYEGSYWSSTVRHHVRFESFLEREWLMSADFDPNTLAVQWQPFLLRWPRGTRGHRSHVPDFFARLSNGDGLVVDVKRPDRLSDERVRQQFDLTREVCAAVGWRYEVFTGLDDVLRENLNFLAGFRQDRYSPEPKTREAFAEVFDGGTSIEFGVALLRRRYGLDEWTIQGSLWHEIWSGTLRGDLTTPLAGTSELVAQSAPSGTQEVAS